MEAQSTNGLTWLNELSDNAAISELLKCCGSTRWATEVAKLRPFASPAELYEAANTVWWSLDREEWLEAFRSHPKIGERKAEVQNTAQAQKWSQQEQSAVQKSTQETIDSLARLNGEYEKKFGYIYIVCASAKSAAEMLGILQERLGNTPINELPIAAAEQARITELRLAKLLDENVPAG